MSEELDDLLKTAYGLYTFYHNWKETACVKEINRIIKSWKNIYCSCEDGSGVICAKHFYEIKK